jgi:hypothetical protein
MSNIVVFLVRSDGETSRVVFVSRNEAFPGLLEMLVAYSGKALGYNIELEHGHEAEALEWRNRIGQLGPGQQGYNEATFNTYLHVNWTMIDSLNSKFMDPDAGWAVFTLADFE